MDNSILSPAFDSSNSIICRMIIAGWSWAPKRESQKGKAKGRSGNAWWIQGMTGLLHEGPYTALNALCAFIETYCYKLIQGFRITWLFTGQYNTKSYGTITDVIYCSILAPSYWDYECKTQGWTCISHYEIKYSSKRLVITPRLSNRA